MFVKYQINSSIFASGTTASTINIPITMDYQIVDNGELIERVFVNTEVQKSVNPILDYEKVRFKPYYNEQYYIGTVNQITYKIGFLKNGVIPETTYYSDIGFDNDDMKFERNYFLNSSLYLGFYDSDNALTQNLVSEIEIQCNLNKGNNGDFLDSNSAQNGNSVGLPKQASAIPVRLIVSNPLTNKDGFYEGYNIYDYKDEYNVTPSKYLYMKASFFNAKDGKTTNLMTSNTAYSIDKLINKLYTRYILFHNEHGYYYEIDTTYSDNIDLTGFPNITVNLYQIQTT